MLLFSGLNLLISQCFDEIFELPNGLTLAELSPDKKNKISARYLALKDLNKKLSK